MKTQTLLLLGLVLFAAFSFAQRGDRHRGRGCRGPNCGNNGCTGPNCGCTGPNCGNDGCTGPNCNCNDQNCNSMTLYNNRRGYNVQRDNDGSWKYCDRNGCHNFRCSNGMRDCYFWECMNNSCSRFAYFQCRDRWDCQYKNYYRCSDRNNRKHDCPSRNRNFYGCNQRSCRRSE